MSKRRWFFKILSFREIIEEVFVGSKISVSEASVKVRVKKSDGSIETVHESADGNGPVNALDKALRKALNGFFPEISKVKLTDYNVRKIRGGRGTESSVEVAIEFFDGVDRWVSRGASNNIIKASCVAIAKSLKKEIQQVLASK